MTSKARNHGEDLRGASRLAIDATRAVTEVVEAMHLTLGGGPDLLGSPLERPLRVLTAPVYGSIKAVTKLVGAGLELALGQLAPLLGESTPGPEREALLAALNGVVGDHLEATGNPLSIPMALRREGHPLELEPAALRAALPGAAGRVVVLVHGSSMADVQWNRRGHDHGAALARDLGVATVYLHYNSGRHISTNGRDLAELLERMVRAWPVPIEQLDLVGHSMGGLVSRSACHHGEVAAHAWRAKLGRLVCLGTPHHGAPLERGGHWFELLLGGHRYSAPLARLGRLRSAGVTDMRFGNVLDEDWQGRDRFAPHTKDTRTHLPLPSGVACFALAATTSATPGPRLLGDGLVPVDSALGKHRVAARTLRFPVESQRIVYGTGHLELLDRPQVYEALRGWLG